MRAAWSIFVLVLLTGSASAGSRDEPEVPDPEGDCAFAAGNEYADVTAAWISEETSTDFLVNIELAKWTQDALGSYAGYTLQFTHQDVQWGVAAFYEPQGGWEWSTAHFDTQTGEMRNFSATSGSWDPASTTMSITFAKSLFPHAGNDNKLRGFIGGTADLKKDIPVFLAQGVGAPVPSQDIMTCDTVESSAEYEFTLGQHTMGTPAAPTDAPMVTPTGGEELPTGTPSPTPSPQGTPGFGPLLALGVLACLAASRRRS